MLKLKSLVLLVSILAVMGFIPIGNVGATYTYIGIQVDTVKRLSTMVDTCLLQGTTMAVMSGMNTLDTVTTTTTVGPTASPTSCAGNKIWSNLINITDGAYSLKIITPFCWGYWKQYPGGVNQPYYCWHRSYAGGNGWGFDRSCNEICTENGSTGPIPNFSCGIAWDENCSASKALFGITCSSCYQSSYAFSGIDSPSSSTSCYANYYYNGSNGCDWKTTSYSFVCPCVTPTGTYDFPFNFTAP